MFNFSPQRSDRGQMDTANSDFPHLAPALKDWGCGGVFAAATKAGLNTALDRSRIMPNGLFMGFKRRYSFGP